MMLRTLILVLMFLPQRVRGDEPCRDANFALHEASKLSGLSALRKTNCQSLNREKFRALAKETILKDIDLKQLPSEEIILKELGIIPAEYQYTACLLDSYATSAAAFYSPSFKRFIIPDWIQTPKAILVHEAQHALQDQHFDTKRFGKSKFLISDENLAASALLEGDAMDIESRYGDSAAAGEVLDPDPAGRLPLHNSKCEMPPILEEILSAPYDYGLLFVRNIRSALGPDFRQLLFAHPPRQTEEILHGNDYLENIRLKRALELNDSSQSGLFQAEIGEMSIRILLRSFISKEEAILAAAGLVCDRIKIIEQKGRQVIRWMLQFKTEEDAQQFRIAWTRQINLRYQQSIQVGSKGWRLSEFSSKKSIGLQQRGNIVEFASISPIH